MALVRELTILTERPPVVFVKQDILGMVVVILVLNVVAQLSVVIPTFEKIGQKYYLEKCLRKCCKYLSLVSDLEVMWQVITEVCKCRCL
jgi:hypothetical protein